MKKLAIIVILLLQAGLAAALTLADIRTAVRRNVQDTATDTTLQSYSDAYITALVNEGQREIVTMTWAVESSTSLVLTAGTANYPLPDDTLAVFSALYQLPSGITSELDEVGERTLYSENPDFARQTGKPLKYFVRINDRNETAMEMVYVPNPTSASTGTVTIKYAAQAADLAADADVPFNGLVHLSQYHQNLVYFATARIKLLEHRPAEAQAYLQLYTGGVTSMKDRLNQMPNFRPQMKGTPGVGR